jgi:hypothetical protein
VIPASVRNCNPLNIRPGAPYEGLTAQVNGFCVFKSPVWGFRAAFRNYITKADRGVNTIAKLIGEWAPPGDNNDTAAYIASVCNATGYGPDDPINLKSWPVASAVCYAQTMVETGAPFEQYWKLAQMAEGAFRAGLADAPPPTVTKIATRVTGIGSAVTGTVAATQSSNPKMQAALVVMTIVLAAMAAIWPAKSKTEG